VQISRVYSNRPAVFAPITLNYGIEANHLNVIYGEVRRPSDKARDSHNLGKTTLLHLIDFLLLKGMSPDHFLQKHKDRFEGFVFFVELALNAGDYVTIRRGAANPNDIAMKRHTEPGLKFASASDDIWDHPKISRENAVKLLDAWLDLSVVKPYDYRKAITYFLRAQGDYNDELQLQKFSAGKDQDWKPFVAHLFGFNEAPVVRKYELDESISKLKSQFDERQAEVQFNEDQLPELTARLSVLQQQADEAETELDAFSFDREERRMMTDLVENLEVRIADINERVYNIRYDLNQINAALTHRDKFDLKEVAEIFSEASINFPDALKRKYEDLVVFNRKVTNERNAELRKRQAQLAEEEVRLVAEKGDLDHRREMHLKLLRGTDTFEKFKQLQNRLTHDRAQIVYLGEQQKKLQLVADIARKMREEERERGRTIDEIKAMVQRPTPIYKRFTMTFSNYCQRVLNHDGVFYFKVNMSGNLDHGIGLSLQGEMGMPSSQSEGASYRKLVCALFDLALLKVYENAPFFHFVYHDGIFEGLDDRKKLAFMEVVREQTASKKTQYIMTMIDSDMPRDSKDQRVEFPDNEIVLRLHDEGENGRLFKMGEF
jgi:uncharacterized protein YydD (DUF2326 family)